MSSRLPIWAGVECTVNRVGDRYFDQCARNGHQQRLEDLARFQELGIERIRYPLLWEQIETEPGRFDWNWADERMSELRRLNLKPIIGLLHHGSGPRFTNLLDPEFPILFSTYAARVAERYPEIEDYTPINEPLTTARFSALYGHWFPHAKQDKSFLAALMNQIKASVLALQEVRKINPKARWIQTEDLGFIQGTEPLQAQVDFENNRRWLSFDLLFGKMNPSHPLWDFLISIGLRSEDIDWLHKNSVVPDILGINHYLLSNRYLDHRLEHYPTSFHGGNGRERYADVGVIDTKAAGTVTPETVFKQAWERYQKPLAITEVHLHGFREDQLRWLHQVHQAALNLRAHGVDIQAMTAWSLLGSFDWNSLCTREDGFYESGIFDVRSPKPRPTVLAKAVKAWAHGQDFHHPLLTEEGWWKFKERALFGPVNPALHSRTSGSVQRPLLITGAEGTLGRAFARICASRNIPFLAFNRRQLDITQLTSVLQSLQALPPWAIVNAAGYVRVDDAENEKEKCFLENVTGPENLARASAELGIPFLHFSSDLVFGGNQNHPYLESHSVSPLNVYGESKVLSEKKVLELHPESLIVRASSYFGPWDEHNFIFKTLSQLTHGESVYATADITISPTYVPDLVHLCLDLLIDGEKGVFHLTNEGHVSWANLARKAAEIASAGSFDISGQVIDRSTKEMNFTAARPRFSALSSERIRVLPNFENALHRYFKELEIPFKNKQNSPLENRI